MTIGLELDWRRQSAALADAVCPETAAQWHDAVTHTPRHVLVPRWWTPTDGYTGWDLNDGPTDPAAWLSAAYSDTTLITRAGTLHADHAGPGQQGTGQPTSSSTLPGLVVTMLVHLDVDDGMRVVDVATGSGYSAALLSRQQGARNVLSVDIDPYLTTVAAQRLATLGHHPRIETIDATGALPDDGFDRLIAMVSVRPIPTGWLTALRPGGRLVTTIAGTSLLVTAQKKDDGSATGHVVPDVANFMPTRDAIDYPPRLDRVYCAARDADGDDVRDSSILMPDLWTDWQLRTVLVLAEKGVEERTMRHPDGRDILWLLHPSGAWARAETRDDRKPRIHQAGPLRLWDEFERAHARWYDAGCFDLRDMSVTVDPDGTTEVTHGTWRTVL